jgi:hypothetical protein
VGLFVVVFVVGFLGKKVDKGPFGCGCIERAKPRPLWSRHNFNRCGIVVVIVEIVDVIVGVEAEG